jgi:predicted alpha/beta-fold hydrolase
VETIAIAKLRSNPRLAFRREILLTPDGGALAIDWEHQDLEEHVRGAGEERGRGCAGCKASV